MRLYNSETDELLMLYWFLNLRADPVEFENLFAEPLRHLTSLLIWAKNDVNVMIDVDDDGIRFSAWCAPFLSGAEFGTWARKSLRGTKAHLNFMDEAYTRALSMYPVLIGLTKQEKLHSLHLRMGYKFIGIVPSLFDGSPVREYYMTQETRDERRKFKDIERHADKPLRATHRKVRKIVPAVSEGVRATGNGSSENGGSERADTDHKPRRGRKPRSRVVSESGHATSLGESGAG